MRITSAIFVLTMILTVDSCSSEKPAVAVGMTYAQVENVLGKPTQISRGMSHLHTDQRWASKHYSMIDSVCDPYEWNVSNAKFAILSKAMGLQYNNDVPLAGEIAVDNKIDKILDSLCAKYRPHISYVEALDTLYFNKVAVLEGQDSCAWRCPQNVETGGQLIYVTWRYPKMRTDTFYTYQFDLTFSPTGFSNTPPIKSYYAVHEQECVTFDASSGRVVVAGYQPMSIERCK